MKAREADRSPGARVETGDDLNPQLRAALDRAQRFLSVSLVLTAALAAVAIGMAARQHAERHRQIAATFRALGARQGDIVGLYVGTLAILGGIAILAALLAAAVLQQVAGAWIAEQLGATLPPARLLPLLQGALVGVWILVTFALPPLLALRRVSALAVLRSDLRTPSPPALALFALAMLGLLALFWQAAGNARPRPSCLAACWPPPSCWAWPDGRWPHWSRAPAAAAAASCAMRCSTCRGAAG